MSYVRVIPRDLFNEADLLKCWGKLWIALEGVLDRALVIEYDGRPFDVMQDPSDGSISLANVRLLLHGMRVPVRRPLNSRAPGSLYLDHNGEEIRVFDETGTPTVEFAKWLLDTFR